MVKKILIFIFVIAISFSLVKVSYSNCSYDGGGTIVEALENCVGDGQTDLVETGSNLDVDKGFKEKLIVWIKKIATYLAFGAIFSIGFGSLKMILSGGEEEKIKKGKDVVKWGIIGFLGVVSAGFIISVAVKLIYSIGGS